MDNRSNIREMKRLVNILLSDLSNVSNEELLELQEISHRIFTHAKFEESFRSAIEKAKKEVVLTP